MPDYYLKTKAETYSLLESTSSTEMPDLSCSFSGSTSITFSIADYNTQAPSWVTINSSSGQLSISSPSVSADTTFSFYINSAVASVSAPVQKLISMTVLNWAVEFCISCSSSPSICSIWSTGYNLTASYSCSAPTSNPTDPISRQAKIHPRVSLQKFRQSWFRLRFG